ncbi:MAG: ribonuclease HIII [Bacilli bacterium]|nr:ribonuclease HIII [Bacilli bacterium]
MTYATIKVDLAKASEIKDFIHATEINDENHPYDFFDGSYENVHVHAYKNKKEIFTITFTGEGNRPAELASFFAENVTVKEHANTPVKKADKAFECWEDFGPQIGSDEVGKGDFFGPLIVVACYVDKKDIEYLEKLKINDSKKMKDDYILEIGPSIKRRIKNYVVAVSANKLSVMNENNFNIDKILSLCHNHAQRGLIEKYDIPSFVITYIDQFLAEDNYKRYVADDLIENPLYFRTKGETYYPSVAAASVIARYTFLKEWQAMEDKFKTKIPKGAGAQVDTVFGRLKNQYGIDAVNPYIKRFFSNYKKNV